MTQDTSDTSLSVTGYGPVYCDIALMRQRLTEIHSKEDSVGGT